MNIKLPHKFADNNIDHFVHTIFKNHEQNPTDYYYFDLTEVEHIGNQELLVFSAILKLFVNSKVEFKVEFFKEGIPTKDIPVRVKKQIIQIWEVWKIWQIVPSVEYFKYFGIDGNSVERLERELNYFPKVSEIYTRHGVTPFVSLDYINNYNEQDVQSIIDPIYQLNSAINELLKDNKCQHPFTSKSLSTIITEELYLNFLDHSINSSFRNLENLAFMSISVQGKLDEKKNSSEEIQKIKQLNFETECLNESKEFYYNDISNEYKNESYIQFSFLDFGQGIVNTLKEQFRSQNTNADSDISDSEILKYSFNHNSSRHPILDRFDKDKFIPRGLFDVLTIVRRYKGLLVVRSNYGKVLYDFSKVYDGNNGITFLDKEAYYFPGTLVSVYIPALEDNSRLNTSSIKSIVDFGKVKTENKKRVSFLEIVDKLTKGKEGLYNSLLNELRSSICSKNEAHLVLFSFEGTENVEKRLIKKALYFLLSDYEINYFNNVVILNLPQSDLLDELELEILNLNTAIKNYKLHPLPIIRYDYVTQEIDVRWLGVYDDSDRSKLNDLLYSTFSVSKSDFNEPDNISGHINDFDQHGNLITNFPSKEELRSFYDEEIKISYSNEVRRLIEKHDCLRDGGENSIFLCPGNYYQRQYIELTNLVNNKNDCQLISKIIYDSLIQEIKTLPKYKFLGVTTNSQKILKSMELQGLISSDDYVTLDSYYTFEYDLNLDNIDSNQDYILISDVLGTGYLANRLNKQLREVGSQIAHIGVVINTLDSSFTKAKSFIADFENKLTFLYKLPIDKFNKTQIKNELERKDIVRINPHTDIPITLSLNDTSYSNTVIFSSDITHDKVLNNIEIKNHFLDSIDTNNIKVGFLKFNNLIHPYFFETNLILKSLTEKVLGDIFTKINKPYLNTETVKLFYPRKSGIEYFNVSKLKAVLRNHAIDELIIERFGTLEGWRFPHNSNYLGSEIENNVCLILDDGSCTGDSLIQMIDEIAFYKAREVILLCFIGRVHDHKREFFSRLSQIRVKDGALINVSIYFVTHWHIPTYYVDENPNTRERAWLNEVINMPNTPQPIKKIANSVLSAITPRSTALFKDYKYLPKTRVDNTIPKKELLIIREELGKVIGYRLYKESFKFFDCFFRKYLVVKNSKDRYKEIELLCATFIYEPYLYDRIKGIMPDIIEQIEDFVRVLIFSNEKIYDLLTYEWNKKDIVHLFFIVFKNEKLIDELTEDNFSKFNKLVAFTMPKESALNYVLYKILFYIPIKVQDFDEKKHDVRIKDVLSRLSNESSFVGIKEVKKFYNYIISLPSRSDYTSQIAILRDNYLKQTDPEFHDEKISFNHNVSLAISTLRQAISQIKSDGKLAIDKIQILRSCWFDILNFINPILSFSSTFKQFLVPYPYFTQLNKIETGFNSLRAMVGFNEDVILQLDESFNDTEKLNVLIKNITKIQSDFEVNSTFHQLVDQPGSNFKDLIENLKMDINALGNRINYSGNDVNENMEIQIPIVYSDLLLKKELVTNIKKHSKKDSDSIVDITYQIISDNKAEVIISNVISESLNDKSNGEGIKCLKLLAEFEPFGFHYTSKNVDNKFVQTLTFKINGNDKN